MLLFLVGCEPKDPILYYDNKVAIEEGRYSGTLFYHNVYKKDMKKIFDIYEKYAMEGNTWDSIETVLFHQGSVFKFYFNDDGSLAGFELDLNYPLLEADHQFIKKYKLKDVINKIMWMYDNPEEIEKPTLNYEVGDYVVYVPSEDSKLFFVATKGDVSNQRVASKIKSYEERYQFYLEQISFTQKFEAEQAEKELQWKQEAENNNLISKFRDNLERIYPQFQVENEVDGDGKITIVLRIDFSEVDVNYIHDIKLKYKLEYPLRATYEDELVIENTGEVVEIRREVNYPNVEFDSHIHTMNRYETSTEIIEVNTIEVPSILVGKEDLLGEY